MNSQLPRIQIVVLLLIFGLLPLQADAVPKDRYQHRQAMISMRDGVKLHTEISRPKDVSTPLPILFTRTPYGPWNNKDGSHDFLDEYYADLAEEGYIFVFQDIRGRDKSEGEFVMLRPVRDRSIPNSVDESTDAYDTIEWLLANVPNHNGKVGMLGVSYPGWLAMMAMINPHPALACISPQASPADMYIGDDFAHRGAFRLSPSFGYAVMMESGKRTSRFKFDVDDVYEWFLKLGPLSNANRDHLKGKFPTWNAFMAHPNYDAYWHSISLLPLLKEPTVPVLNVAGWYDAEDFYGSMIIYEMLERRDAKKHNSLVVGPWYHGSWRRGSGAKWRHLEFGSPTGSFFRAEVQRPWLAHHLHGKPKPMLPEALVFETGGNSWSRFDAWPPKDLIQSKQLYLHADGHASFQAPSVGSQAVSYVSDPANPVPYAPRPIAGFWQGGGKLWKIADQRFLSDRQDVVTWVSKPLKEDLVVAGEIEALLYASTSGTDCDWIVRLIDVHPEKYPVNPKLNGFHLMVAGDVMRAKFRDDYSTPKPLTPNEITGFRFGLHARHHRFKAGHRIMVQVQSSWFPLIDRNPQKFVDIPKATASDYQVATKRISCSMPNASSVIMPVIVAP